MARMKIKEVIWEIIPTCNKNCSYCGSKEITSLDKSSWLKPQEMMNIIDNFYNYCPDAEINLSGGEPGLILYDNDYKTVFNYMIEKFPKGIKIVTNGEFIKAIADDNNINSEECSSEQHINYENIVVIGLSYNDVTEKERIEELIKTANYYGLKITIITNFGNHNIFDFKEIYKTVNEFDCMWQVQLTHGKESLATNGIKHLREMINELKDEKIVMADDLQVKHTCSSGIASMGVLYTGDVVGCLAERTFNKDNLSIQGNLLNTSIKEIWENNFKDCRFGDRKCCRDYIDYPKESCQQSEKPSNVSMKYGVSFNKNNNIGMSYGVMKYGVSLKKNNKIDEPIVDVYGVTYNDNDNDNIRFVYGTIN